MTRLITLLLTGLIRAYQVLISPLFPASCRFSPTCSVYMEEAIKTWGPVKGTFLGIKRILRCNPYGGQGYDPVPPKKKD